MVIVELEKRSAIKRHTSRCMYALHPEEKEIVFKVFSGLEAPAHPHTILKRFLSVPSVGWREPRSVQVAHE